MSPKRRLFALLSLTSLFLTASTATRAQTFRFQHITVNDGLSDNMVRAIIQDRNGFIWAGTLQGLNRYDGYGARVYRAQPGDTTSLSHDYVWALLESSDGAIWVGTSGGLSRFDPLTGTFTQYHHDPSISGSLSDDEVRALAETADGSIWVGTGGGGLDHLRPGSTTFDIFRHRDEDPSSLCFDNVYSLVVGSDGSVWVGTAGGGVSRFDPATETFENYGIEEGLSHRLVYSLENGLGGSIWAGTLAGLDYFEPQTDSFVPFHAPARGSGDVPAIEEVWAIRRSGDGLLWLGTASGLIRLDPTTGRTSTFRHAADDPTSLSYDQVRAIAESRDGSIWIGTNGAGMDRVDVTEGPFRLQRHIKGDPSSLRSDAVFSLAEGSDGSIWVGTKNGGLNRLDPITGTFTTYLHNDLDPSSLSTNDVYALEQGRNGILWVGTSGGFDRFDQTKLSVKTYRPIAGDPTSLSAAYVASLQESRDGSVWLGTWGGLDHFDPRSETFRVYRHDDANPASLGHGYVAAVHEDPDGVLWVGTLGGGLNRLAPGSDEFERFRNRPGDPTSLSHNDVQSIYRAHDGTLWIGTGNGINRVEESTSRVGKSVAFVRYTAENSDYDGNAVQSMLEADDGLLWLGLKNGRLASFDPRSGRFRSFGPQQGVDMGGFFSAAVRAHDGRMYFGGFGGLISFDPNKIWDAPEAPRLKLTQLRLFNQPVRPGPDSPLKKPLSDGDEVILGHDQNDVSIDFVGLFYHDPKGTRYDFRLTPLNKTWRGITDQRQATYTNLPPGRYKFEVRAVNSDGIWTEKPTSVDLVIRPPWWQTRWSYLLYALLLVGLVLGVDRVQRRRVVLRERRRAELREAEILAQTAEDKAHALEEIDELKSRFFANISHEFRTPLTLILGPLEQRLKEADSSDERRETAMMHRQAGRLLRLINQLLDLSRLDTGRLELSARRIDVVDFLRSLVVSFAPRAESDHISLQFAPAVERADIYVQPDKLEKIVSNLLSNAFSFTPAHGKIRLSVAGDSNTDGAFVEIAVEDTGAGIPEDQLPRVFDRFFQADQGARRALGGSGIGLALAKELVELHGGTIHAESRSGFGTKVVVRFRQGKDHLRPEDLAEDADQVMSPDAPEIRVTDFEREAVDETGAEADPGGYAVSADAPIVLIVEDNPDVRAYLRRHLAQSYRVEEALDGADGLTKAKELAPDLVVSDVMMPRMDGFALTAAIKADETISHTPVILLTARAEDEDRIEGLETGADDYISKPFNMEELMVRVENLIEVRRALRERFTGELTFQPSNVTISSAEAELLERVRRVIDAELGNGAFTVEMLADAVGLSTRQLYRDVKGATRLSPGGLIRTMRLERAAQLLATKSLRISEVAYAVGFSDVRHFSRLFRQTFGVTPTDYEGS